MGFMTSATAPDMKGNFSTESFMGLENCTLRVNRKTISSNTKDIGNELNLMAEERPFTKMETSLKELLSMDFEEAMELMTLIALLDTKVNGKRTSFMGLGNSLETGSYFFKENFKTA